MKKKITVYMYMGGSKLLFFFIFTIVSFSAFPEKKIENTLSFGFGVPQILEKTDLNSGKTIQGFAVSMQAKDILVYKKHLAFTADLELGGVYSSDVFDKKDQGNFFDFTVGIGYAFVNTDKFLLVLSGLAGYEFMKFSDEKNRDDDSYYKTVYTRVKSSSFVFGANLCASYSFNRTFGVYLNLKALYSFGVAGVDDVTKRTDKKKYKKETLNKHILDTDIRGWFLSPTIGVLFRY